MLPLCFITQTLDSCAIIQNYTFKWLLYHIVIILIAPVLTDDGLCWDLKHGTIHPEPCCFSALLEVLLWEGIGALYINVIHLELHWSCQEYEMPTSLPAMCFWSSLMVILMVIK